MEIGVNYAWNSYGHDFGGSGDPPWKAGIDGELSLLKSLGISKVRWFIVRGNTLADFGPLSSKFLSDFEMLLSIFQAHAMQLLPSWIGSGMWQLGSGHGDCSSLVLDSTASARFLATSLAPLLSVAERYQDAVYAFEVASEPDLVGTSKSYTNTIPLASMTRFLQAGVGLVNGAGLPSTVGYQNIDNVPRFPVTGVAVPQFHYYGWPHVLPSNPVPPGYIIGEAPTGAQGNFPELPAVQSLTDRLIFLKAKGYPLVFLWGMHSTDPETRWDATTQAEIKAFTGGQIPAPPPPPPAPHLVDLQRVQAKVKASYDALIADLGAL